MLRTAWSEIRRHPRRMVALVVSIVIGVGFAGATVVFTDTYGAGLGASVSATTSRLDVLVGASPSDIPAARLAEDVAAVPGVAHAEPLYSAGADYATGQTHGSLSIDVLPRSQQLRWFELAEGNWPRGADQIAVDAATAQTAGLRVGSAITLSDYQHTRPLELTVAGIVDTSRSALAGARMRAYAPPAVFGALHQDRFASIAVIGDGSIDPQDLRTAVAAALPDGTEVRTRDQQLQAELAEVSGNADVVRTALLAFAVIAMVVAAIVIANTFTILLAQRRRHIALLRCVGARTGQVRRSVLIEALLLGLIGAALGLGVAVAAGLLTADLTGLDGAGPVVQLLPLVLIGLAGVAVTVLAAWLPARRAALVAPLVALRPDPAGDAAIRRSSRLRLATGLLTVLAGGAGLAGGLTLPSLLVAVGGGLVSAVGVLLLTPTFLPPLLRLAGKVAGAAGAPGRLAAGNAVRNTGRSAATSAALLVGVTLIVTVQVAAASASESLDAGIADRYPVDVTAMADAGPDSAEFPAELADRLAQVPEVTTAPVYGATATLDTGSGSSGADDAGQQITVVGVDDSARALLRGGTARLDDRTVLVPSWQLGGPLQLGDSVTLTAGGHSAEFTVAVGRVTDATPQSSGYVLTMGALHRLVADPHVVGVWGSVADRADVGAVTAELNRLIGPYPQVRLGGGAGERASVGEVLNTLITVALALLAVAVLIAVIGIGNTLGLSVIERTRENGLLRALGLRRRQLRLMLSVEALLLAVAGTAAGIGLGLLYGWAGASAAMAEADRPVVFAVPWWQLAGVAVLAAAAGVLASVLPARRAVRAAPTAALAVE